MQGGTTAEIAAVDFANEIATIGAVTTAAQTNFLQFDNAKSGGKIKITADSDCNITRCGKNLSKDYSGLDWKSNNGTNYPISITLVDDDAGGFARIIRTGSETYAEISIYRGYNFVGCEAFANRLLVCSNYVKSNFYIQLKPTAGQGDMSSTSTWQQILTEKASPVMYDYLASIGHEAPSVLDLELDLKNNQLESGSMMTAYEPYNGMTQALSAGETIYVDALEGVNTVWCDAGTLQIAYGTNGAENEYGEKIRLQNMLVDLGVTPAETIAEMQAQLDELGVDYSA